MIHFLNIKYFSSSLKMSYIYYIYIHYICTIQRDTTEAENSWKQQGFNIESNNIAFTAYLVYMYKYVFLLKLVDLQRNVTCSQNFYSQRHCDHFNINFHWINEAKIIFFLHLSYCASEGYLKK